MAASKRNSKSKTRRSRSAVAPKTYKLYVNGKFPRTESGRYIKFESKGKTVANICRASRKDFREAVVAARQAQPAWAKASAYLKGQIVYRIAEMLEGRQDQFVGELLALGFTRAQAQTEVERTLSCLVHYTGWSDKFFQLFSTVNPVASNHFNFSVPEAMGVVGLIAPKRSPLLGLVANVVPAILGGNTVVALAAEDGPTLAISFSEVLHSSDVPAGVVNLLTGYTDELLEHFASHMDVNSLIYCQNSGGEKQQIQQLAAGNLKRVVVRTRLQTEGPYTIKDTLETKTTWHPIGG